MELTVKQYAEEWDVKPRTVRRWIEKHAVQVQRTPGGRIFVLGPRRCESRVAVFDMSHDDRIGHDSK
jgi:hypothetical protein